MRGTGLALAAAAMLAGGLPALAGQQFFPASPSGYIEFVMPSNNVGCIYTPAGGSSVYVPADGGPELQCDRVAPSYLRFILSASGPAQVISDVADASCCGSANVFAYGNTWKAGPYVCKSATTGLTCSRGAHGFRISKANIKAY
ncbi:MAG TPA: hypothetical protein VFB16_01755 [Bauldia sp.]|nr:hypothetical protein [Bauldia sp.]